MRQKEEGYDAEVLPRTCVPRDAFVPLWRSVLSLKDDGDWVGATLSLTVGTHYYHTYVYLRAFRHVWFPAPGLLSRTTRQQTPKPATWLADSVAKVGSLDKAGKKIVLDDYVIQTLLPGVVSRSLAA